MFLPMLDGRSCKRPPGYWKIVGRFVRSPWELHSKGAERSLTGISQPEQRQRTAFDLIKVGRSWLFDLAVKDRKHSFFELVDSEAQAAIHIEINTFRIRLGM